MDLLEENNSYTGFLKVQRIKLEEMNLERDNLSIKECIRILDILIDEDFGYYSNWYEYEDVKEKYLQQYLKLLNQNLYFWEG